MLGELSFEEAVTILEKLQNQFKEAGWEPWEYNGSAWFDLTPDGRKQLHARMFERESGYMQTAVLRVPKLYGMIFRLKCPNACERREPPYKFVIDVGIGPDVFKWEKGDPLLWQPSHPAASRKGMK